MLEFNVRGQKLTRIDSFEPAEKSVGYLRAKVNFLTDEWKSADTVTLRAKNQKDIVVHEADVVDGIALVPWEALESDGTFSVSLFARAGEAEITTGTVAIGLLDTLEGGMQTNPPTPTEFDKLRQDVDDLKKQVDNLEPGGGVDEAELKAAVESALEEAKASGEFDGPKGDPGDDYVLTEADKQEIADMVPVPEVPSSAVLYTPQAPTPEQQKQARDNVGAWPIIDVVELPTENIREDCFYRLLSGSLVINQSVQNMYTIHCVETLPESGLPATNIDKTEGNVYYNVSDGEAYGYVDDILSAGLGVPAGWYPAATLLGALGYEYAGVITNILDDPEDGKFRLLLEYVVYDHKNGNWTSHKKIGRAGTGASAEIFNKSSNKATGYASHAEGDSTHAEGAWSHAEGIFSHAEGDSSHAEGYFSQAKGDSSHAEGYFSQAKGDSSHAEGNASHAEGNASHAEGNGSRAVGMAQHVQGEYNLIDPEYNPDTPGVRAKYAHIVGNGTNEGNRSNAHTIDWEGNGWFAGTVEGTALILKSPNGTRFRITVGDDGVLSATTV